MFTFYIYLVLCLTISTINGQESQTEKEFEKLDAFHTLGKCSHANCQAENQEFTEVIEKSDDLQKKFESCSKCRIKPYEELNVDEKRTLVNCIKQNDCETSSRFHEKYKDNEQFKQLMKCLDTKCTVEYKAIQKYITSKTTTPTSSVTPPTNDASA